MAHSRITAGLCALVISAIGAPAALAQMSSGAGLAAGRAEAELLRTELKSTKRVLMETSQECARHEEVPLSGR